MTKGDNDEIVVLTDEDDVEHEFSVVDVIEVDGNEYAILLPMDQEPDEDGEEEAVILRVESDEDGEDILVEIEDEDEWDRVAGAWEDISEEEE